MKKVEPITREDFMAKMDHYFSQTKGANPDYEGAGWLTRERHTETFMNDTNPIVSMENDIICWDEQDVSKDNIFPFPIVAGEHVYSFGIANGDWEMPALFVIYWDKTRFRAYVPLKGNTINPITNQAYGNDDDLETDVDQFRAHLARIHGEEKALEMVGEDVEYIDQIDRPAWDWDAPFAAFNMPEIFAEIEKELGIVTPKEIMETKIRS